MYKYILILLMFSSPVYAGKWTEFFTGAITSLAVHELSHEIIARAYGQQLRWNGLEWSCNCSQDSIKPIAIAGLVSHIVSSEILLKQEQTPYVRGWLAFNMFNQVWYPIRGGGDLENFTQKEQNAINIISVFHAATVVQRSNMFIITKNSIHIKIFL